VTQRLDLKLLVERSAWAAGSVLLIGYSLVQWQFARSHQSGLQEFAAAVQESRAPAGVVTITQLTIDSAASLVAAAPDMSSWSSGRITAYQSQDVSAAPRTVLAVLRIPSIDLEVPVYAGVTEANLNRGAAWIETTAPLGMPGNTALASHRDGYFRALGGISVGDRIELQTLQHSKEYAVDDIRVVEPEAVHVLAPSGDERLTLVTCYPFYMVGPAPKRFIVRAHAASAPNIRDPS